MSDPTEISGSGPELKALLEQVQILANQIKKSAFALEDSPLVVGQAVLEMLQASGPQTVPALAERRNSSRQNVQIVVNRLERFGLVEFAPNPAHRKSGLVRITERGKTMVKRGAEQESKLLEELVRQIDAEDLEPARRLLGKLQNVLAGREGPHGHPARTNAAPKEPTEAGRTPKQVETGEQTIQEDYSLPYNLL